MDNNITNGNKILKQNQKDEEKIKKSLEKFWKVNKEKLLSLSNEKIELNNLSSNNNLTSLSSLRQHYLVQILWVCSQPEAPKRAASTPQTH